MNLIIGHLYPDLLNLYGDRGNVIALEKRCHWRGIDVTVRPLLIDDDWSFTDCDILFLGGGQDREQEIVWRDLMHQKAAFREAAEEGVVVLAVCGGYQLLGHYYRTPDGKDIEGLGILDLHTVAGKERLIGNAVITSPFFDEPNTLVGFENHGGKTYLGSAVRPLGQVMVGQGNNGEDATEGAVVKNVFGTYLHGSLLPKNPHLTDLLLSRALKRKDPTYPLAPLEDTLEWQAHEDALRIAGTS